MIDDKSIVMDNLAPDDLPGDGTGNEGGNNMSANVDDVDSFLDIDSIFGEKSDDQEFQGGRKKTDKPGDNSSFKTDGDIFDGLGSNPQELLRRLQSERDSNKAKATKLESRVKELEPVASFVDSLWDDQEARHAFIAQLEPDLVKPKDPLTFVKEELKKEFGNEFAPDDDTVDPLQKQLYNERARELYKDYMEKQRKLPKSLEELKARRAQSAKANQAKAEEQKKKIREKYKHWNDSTFDTFSKWISKVEAEHMAAYFDQILKAKSKNKAPVLAGQSGGHPFVPSQFKQELDNMFGSN